jgi:hypothetical protein
LKQEYLRLHTHLRCIKSPCPRPPQAFQTIPRSTALRMASDGSFKNERGYHGWIVALTDKSTIMEGHGPTDGRIQDITSYRTEVSGTIAIQAIYNMIVKVYNWKAKYIEHVCDSESVLDRIWTVEPDGVFDQSLPDADVILVAKSQLQKAHHTKITPTWVRGHADKRGTPYTDQEDINMQADKLAGSAHKSLPDDLKARHDSLHFPEQHISLCLHCHKVTSNITRNVAHSFHRPKLEEHIKEREKWSHNTGGILRGNLLKSHCIRHQRQDNQH